MAWFEKFVHIDINIAKQIL